MSLSSGSVCQGVSSRIKQGGTERVDPGSRLSALLRGPKMDLSSGEGASGGRLGMGVTCAV